MRHLNDDAAFEEGAALEASRGAHASSPAPHAATFSCAFEMEIRLVVAPAMAPKDTRGVVVRRPVESAGAATETEAVRLLLGLTNPATHVFLFRCTHPD